MVESDNGIMYPLRFLQGIVEVSHALSAVSQKYARRVLGPCENEVK